MIKKKNYKQESQFSQLHSFTALSPMTSNQGPRKYQIYYKRYRKQQQSQNLYNLLQKDIQSKKDNQGKGNDNKGQQLYEAVNSNKFSEDRTLELISFDGDLGFLKKYLRKIGKIRSYQTGQGIYKARKIHTAMCTFKFQFDLVKCFIQQYLQQKITQSCLHTQTQQDRQNQRHDLITKHLDKQLGEKLSKLKEMQRDGFQVVTDIYGQYRMDMDANARFVEDLPQIKKQRKKQQKQRKLKQQLARQQQQIKKQKQPNINNKQKTPQYHQ